MLDLDGLRSEARLSTGDIIGFGHAIVASGYQAFRCWSVCSRRGRRRSACRSRAVCTAGGRAEIVPSLPLIFLDGLYVVPHEGAKIAIGSTSENVFDEPFATDEQLEALIRRGAATGAGSQGCACDRPLGRPQAQGSGPRPDGGGAAARSPARHRADRGLQSLLRHCHRLADAALQSVLGGAEVEIPSTFRVEHHLA